MGNGGATPSGLSKSVGDRDALPPARRGAGEVEELLILIVNNPSTSSELIRPEAKMNMVGSSNRLPDDGTRIFDELIGRLHYATEDRALDLVAAFTANDRASLAMFCYRKSHLRRIGLAIATTCDLNSLVQEWGVILGRAVFAQCREPSEEPGRAGVRLGPKITLARSAGRHFPSLIDLDNVPQPTC
jgi:hypothetical protein